MLEQLFGTVRDINNNGGNMDTLGLMQNLRRVVEARRIMEEQPRLRTNARRLGAGAIFDHMNCATIMAHSSGADHMNTSNIDVQLAWAAGLLEAKNLLVDHVDAAELNLTEIIKDDKTITLEFPFGTKTTEARAAVDQDDGGEDGDDGAGGEGDDGAGGEGGDAAEGGGEGGGGGGENNLHDDLLEAEAVLLEGMGDDGSKSLLDGDSDGGSDGGSESDGGIDEKDVGGEYRGWNVGDGDERNSLHP